MESEFIKNLFNTIQKEEKKEEPPKGGDLWLPLFLSLLTMQSSKSPDVENLEKQVAYLGGKIDLLERIIIEKEGLYAEKVSKAD